MATKKPAVSKDEKFQNQDFDLFDSLVAIDKKDYGYYDKLSEEQKKKFVPYMMTHWLSAVKASGPVQQYYLKSIDEIVNRHLFNENIQKHPKLQWLTMCASSPGIGKQYHQWIPHLSTKTTLLREPAKIKDVTDYYTKIYPNAAISDISAISKEFVSEHKKKCYIAAKFPNLKQSDIETLSQIITDEDIRTYEQESGNT